MYCAPWERTWCRVPPEVPEIDLAPISAQPIRHPRTSIGVTSTLVSAAIGAVVTAVLMTGTGGETDVVDPTSDSVAIAKPTPTSLAPGSTFRAPPRPPPRSTAETPVRSQPPAPPDHPLSAAPVAGALTSGYGARWESVHYGLDIANDIGTPIVSVTDGVVLESGPASGFGLWVRIRQDDGTVGVYGHINESLVSAGERVLAGQTIATVGNRGNSTGPHLHYEVWQSESTKLDPMAWLRARGVALQ